MSGELSAYGYISRQKKKKSKYEWFYGIGQVLFLQGILFEKACLCK